MIARTRMRLRRLARFVTGASRPGLRRTLSELRASLGTAEAPALVSLDCFETILLRTPGHGRLRAETQSGYTGARLALGRAARAAGGDPEIALHDVYRSLGFSPADAARAVDAALDEEFARTHVSHDARVLLRAAADAGVPVVVTSDTIFSGAELGRLLARHGVAPLAAVFASSDGRAGKFGGALFERVLRERGATAGRVVHVGDDPLADDLSARALGIRTVLLPGGDFRFRFGYETLGPIFAAFAELLFAQSARDGVRRLAFVARDGEFLQRVAETYRAAAGLPESPAFSYVALSRRTTSLPARAALDDDAVSEVAYVRAGGPLFDRVLGYFSLERAAFAEVLERRGIAPGAAVADAVLFELVRDPAFAAIVARERGVQRDRLERYLRDAGVLGDGPVALVDVGWNATTQTALAATFGPGEPPLAAYYLGFWSERAASVASASTGLLGDIRRGRTLLEGAPWLLMAVLESLCRAPHGTTVGYRERAGAVEPVFSESAERAAERRTEDARVAVRAGVLRAVAERARARAQRPAPRNRARLRFGAQLRLLRLAVFPAAWELQSVTSFVVTEGHAAGWSDDLLPLERPHPLRRPKRWLAGLASPWRTGYVAATGGPVASLAFAAVEATLIALDPGIRARLRRVALRLSGRV